MATGTQADKSRLKVKYLENQASNKYVETENLMDIEGLATPADITAGTKGKLIDASVQKVIDLKLTKEIADRTAADTKLTTDLAAEVTRATLEENKKFNKADILQDLTTGGDDKLISAEVFKTERAKVADVKAGTPNKWVDAEGLMKARLNNLGPKNTVPTKRNDNSQLEQGDEYYNLTEKQLNVWNGTEWIPVGSMPDETDKQGYYLTTKGVKRDTAWTPYTTYIKELREDVVIDGGITAVMDDCKVGPGKKVTVKPGSKLVIRHLYDPDNMVKTDRQANDGDVKLGVKDKWVDSFQLNEHTKDRLGVYQQAPKKRHDGSILRAGDQYFNAVTRELNIYRSAKEGWQALGGSNSNALSKSDIVDTLTSVDGTKVLSAKQGKVIKDLLDRIITKYPL